MGFNFTIGTDGVKISRSKNIDMKFSKTEYMTCECCGKPTPINHPLQKTYWKTDTSSYSNSIKLINQHDDFIDMCYRCPECGFSLFFCTKDFLEKVHEAGTSLINSEVCEVLASKNMPEGLRSWLIAGIIYEETKEYMPAGTMFRKAADYCEFNDLSSEYRGILLLRAYGTYFKMLEQDMSQYTSNEVFNAWVCGYLAVDCMRRINGHIGNKDSFSIAKKDFDNINNIITVPDEYAEHTQRLYKQIEDKDPRWYPIMEILQE